MTINEFESFLDLICVELNLDVEASDQNHHAVKFEELVRQIVTMHSKKLGLTPALQSIVQGFPDIVLGTYGIEVKSTENDSWRTIANSVSEGQRASTVQNVYIVFGKFGGEPEVRWAEYGRSIVHVRTSHVPRFEVDIEAEESLFVKLGISYNEFRVLPMSSKMPFIREYARGRLKSGERLWWLEDKDLDQQQHTLDLKVQIYMDLPDAEKRKLRAEAALLCPKVVAGSRVKNKYTDAVSYLITYRGVLCPQARDLFSAGSVAGKERGGNYVLRALMNIQSEMITASVELEDALFVEYWGIAPPKEQRIGEWLRRADEFAKGWVPSHHLFFQAQFST